MAQGFMEALRAKATTKKHVNVLQHIMGFFKDAADGRREAGAPRAHRGLRRGPRPVGRARSR